MSGVCFVDTETTGLDPDRHEIWEVGLILPDGSEHEWQLPVDLSRADPMALKIGRFHERRWKSTIHEDPIMVNGEFSDYEPVNNRTRKRDFAWEFASLTNGLHLAGAVVSFDAERLWKLLRANGECPLWHYHLIDVEALAAGWLLGRAVGVEVARPKEGDGCEWTMQNTEDGPESYCKTHRTTHEAVVAPAAAEPPWDSNELSRAVGVDPKQFDRHTALGDARWAKAIYEAVMGS